MSVRATAAALCVAAAALAAPAASAAGDSGSLRVSPAAPLVGMRSTIDLRLPMRVSAPLSVQVFSPTGLPRTLPLARVGPNRWRATFHFADDGRWTLTVAHARLLLIDRVTVLQPPAALPGTAANSSGGLGGLFGGGR
jgi:hypothetical protein